MQFTAVRGNITNNPKIKEVGDNKVSEMTLAVNYKLGSGDNQKEHTQYFDVEFWDKRAEYVMDLLSKGDEVIIQGGLLHTETNEKDGKTYLNQAIKNADAFYKVSRV